MAIYTITIRQFLKSFEQDNENNSIGYGTINSGEYFSDYNHHNELIEKYYNKIFEKMSLTIEKIDGKNIDTFKKDFCRRFFNFEIGYETWAQFEIAVESALNTQCYNFLKFLEIVRELKIEDMGLTSEFTSENIGDGANKALLNTTPGNDRHIIYDDFYTAKLISYANSIQESYNKQKANSKTKGSQTMPKFQLYNLFAMMPDIEYQIFNILEKNFMGIF